MGSKQLGFELSSWSLRPGVSLALGGVLVVVIIMAATAIFLICYYWAVLMRKAMSMSPLPPPASSEHNTAQLYPASEYKIFMKLAPMQPRTCPPSTVVLMPGEDMPTFLAMPCRSCSSMEMPGMTDMKNEQTKAEGNDAEVKLEVHYVS